MITEIEWDGDPISQPGLYRGVPIWTYHQQLTSTPSVSSGGLRTIWDKSAAHYHEGSYLNPEPKEKPERPHFSLGRAAHHLLLLGRKGFDDEFVVRPVQWSDWRTNDAKKWRADMQAAGKTIITLGELEDIAGMATSLSRHPLVKAGILDGLVERTIVYQDRETGVFVKSRPDAIPNDQDVADLKSTVSVDDDSLQRSITDFAYHQQGALVRSAFAQALDIEVASFSLVFVEKTPPYCVRVVTISPEDLDRGEQQNRVALWKFAQGVKTGEWPGPGDDSDAQFMGLMPYAKARIDARLAMETPAIEMALYEATKP